MTNIQPTAPHTLSGDIQTDLNSLHTRLLALESKLGTDVKGVKAWLKDKWPHFVTWAALVLPLVAKHL